MNIFKFKIEHFGLEDNGKDRIYIKQYVTSFEIRTPLRVLSQFVYVEIRRRKYKTNSHCPTQTKNIVIHVKPGKYMLDE